LSSNQLTLLWSRRQLNIWFLIPLTKKKRTRMPRMCQTMKPILSPFALFPTSIKLSFSNNFFFVTNVSNKAFHNQSQNTFLKLIKLSGIPVLSFSPWKNLNLRHECCVAIYGKVKKISRRATNCSLITCKPQIFMSDFM
jgi:hypothetical protein